MGLAKDQRLPSISLLSFLGNSKDSPTHLHSITSHLKPI